MRQFRQIDVRAIDLEALGVQIAYVMTDSPAHKEACRRNARLIAAAPGLLEALQALRLAREQDKYPSWEKGVPEFAKAEALADAAIAKALGTSP